MKIRSLHRWNVSVKKAITLQNVLASKLVLRDSFKTIRTVAGCDIALDLEKNRGIGGVIVYSWLDLKEIERRFVVEPIRFPYVPGLLAFREAPILLKAFSKLRHEPDLIIFDGQGTAHPRGLGIASHLGLFLNKPTIGCGKSRLCGTYKEPLAETGAHSLLRSEKGEVIGSVLRTRKNTKPVFVSPGHKISLRSAVEIIIKCCEGFRIPKPTREADRFVEHVKRQMV